MIGRNVNLASRIQGYTKGGQILVTTETLSEAGEQVHENKAGTFLVNPKGIQDDILLHDIIGFGEKYLPGYHKKSAAAIRDTVTVWLT